MKQVLTYKTNIKCNGCIATVSPFFEQNKAIKKWDVDLENPDKILTVELEGAEARDLEGLITQAGYKAELVK